jgi:hypothetical protein
MTFIKMTLNMKAECQNAECHYAECLQGATTAKR